MDNVQKIAFAHEQVLALQAEATSAGDVMMSAICAVALGDDGTETDEYALTPAERDQLRTYTIATAMLECERVIFDAEEAKR